MTSFPSPASRSLASALPTKPKQPRLLPDPRTGLTDDEAFFPDEWGSVVLPSGLHENRFKPMNGTAILSFPNPLLTLNSVWVEELTPAERAKIDGWVIKKTSGRFSTYPSAYTIFVPPAFRATKNVKVTLLFAVGSEIVRDGLRTFLEKSSDRVLVLVPGIEGGMDVAAQTIGRPWGIGVTKEIIDTLFTAVGLVGYSWTVDVIACFSTGYWGFNGTINNCAWAPHVLDLTRVRTIAIYDALYEGTRPNPPGKNTQSALDRIQRVNGGGARLYVYEVTGGVPRNARGDTEVPQAWLAGKFPGRFTMINLKQHRTGLGALLYARIFKAAVQDGYFSENVLPAPLRRLMGPGLPPRGSVMSPGPQSAARAAQGKTLLTDWISAHQADIAALAPSRDNLLKQYIAAKKYRLMGWEPPAFDSVLHDGFLFEFGWELLAG